VDASGAGEPSPIAAGLLTPEVATAEDDQRGLLLAVVGAVTAPALVVYLARSRKVAL
jgi:hypothetical protein